MNEKFDIEANVPLPSGYSEVRALPRATPDSYSVHASYPISKLGEISKFYLDYFRKNGWTDIFQDLEDASPSLLAFKKGKADFHIPILEINSEIDLNVSFEKLEHSEEEFDAIVRDTMAGNAKVLIADIESAYSSLDTYSDTGRNEHIHEGDLLSELKFETKYMNNGDLLFRYSTLLSNSIATQNVLSRAGALVRTQSNDDAGPEEYDDVSLAIAAFTGVSAGTSHTVPSLLLEWEMLSLFRLANLDVLEDAEIEDGTICKRLHGKDYRGGENTIWVGKDDFLIRKIEEITDEQNRSTTTYFPETNIEIAPEDMEFRLPPEL